MVDLLEVKDGVLKVRGLDAIDGTPVIDIKVYSPEIDCARNG
jgi:tRNA (Thr-GGU) A37 N-methylase